MSNTYKVTLLRGDGIGPEIVQEALKVLDAAGKKFQFSIEYTDALMGGCAIDATGVPLPQETIDSCLASDAVLLGAVGGYKWDTLPGNLRPEAGLLGIRGALGLFANLRPAKIYGPLKGACPLREDIIGDSMVYIGYIIVSCLQLGATIDYSILMTNNYMEFRETMESREAAVTAIAKSAISILTSGGILTVVGYLLYFTSSIQAISQVGRLVGRGALLSMILVLSLLPALLAAFDKPIRRQQQRAEKRRMRKTARPGKQTCMEGQE
mgnify:CR=1 FL=1